MKQFRKILALLLAVCALCSVLAGCGLLEDVNDLQEALEQKEQEEESGLITEPAETEKTKETEPPVVTEETTEPTEAPTEAATEAPTEEATQPPAEVSYYLFFDYENVEFINSDVLTYQALTGVSCELSSYDWGFLEEDYSNMVVGYDEYRGVYLYEYDWESLDLYFEYLESIGFTSYLTQEYTQGTSYYYENKSTGFFLDIFVVSDSSYVAIEPYLNADPA